LGFLGLHAFFTELDEAGMTDEGEGKAWGVRPLITCPNIAET